jgi:hypothetical protein
MAETDGNGLPSQNELANNIMNTLFAMEAVAKMGRPENRRTLNRLRHVTGRNLRGGGPASTGCGGPAQPGRIPARGHAELVLMISQLC